MTSSDENPDIETEQAQDTPENQVNEMAETEADNINREKELPHDVHEEQPERQEQAEIDTEQAQDTPENEVNEMPETEAENINREKEPPQDVHEEQPERQEKPVDEAESKDVSDSNERKAKPENLLEPDPILEAFEKVHTVEKAVALLEVSDDEKPHKSIAVETKIETNDGVMYVKLIGLKAPNKKERKFTCPQEGCQEFRPTQGQLNSHLQKTHKATF